MKHFLSKKKYQILEQELSKLVDIERKKIGQRLDIAKSFGDLKENAEYHQARDDQGKLEARIKEIEAILKNSEILENKKYEKVQIGAEVILLKKSDQTKKTFQIVDSSETDFSQGKISLETPLAQSMQNKTTEETFEFTAPNGNKIVYEILLIR